MNQKPIMKHPWAIKVIGALLIFLCSYAASSKLLGYQVFVAQLHTHPMLMPFAGFLAWAVPVVELGVAALLVIPGTRLAGLYSATGLLMAFTVYLLLMLLSGKTLPCSCGGIVSQLSWVGHVVFNSVFILLAVTGILLHKGKLFYKGRAKKTQPVRAV